MRKAFITYFIILITSILFGCATGPKSGVDKDILQHQRDVAYLEATIEQYETAIGSCVRELESLRVRAESMETTVDGVIELFGQYQRLVEQLIYNYNELQKQVRNTKQDINYTTYNNYNKVNYYYHRLYSNAPESKYTTVARYTALEGEYNDRRKNITELIRRQASC